MSIEKVIAKVKSDSVKVNALDIDTRNIALKRIAEALKENEKAIFAANEKDIIKAAEEGIAAPILKRVKFDEQKLDDVIKGIEDLINLEDPLFQMLLARELDQGLTLYKQTVPIGVIGVIFEARPDALVQIASLCLKSGNCAILKGGSEAAATNRVLYEIIEAAAKKADIPEGFLTLVETRADIDELLQYDKYIDLLIPRGSNSFVQYIMENSKIPVMGHADGICHVYVDKDADYELAEKVIVDSKTQYVAACNAVETVLVHKDIAYKFLPILKEGLEKKNVTIKGCHETQRIIECEKAEDIDFDTEYLDYTLSIKIVDTLEDAIAHINKHGSHHTDSIITTNVFAARDFMQYVDSAGVYQNCSTRFADGFRYGFGAEVGISTSKLHARGPVGLDGLVTYKYKIIGAGHIVSDYAEGKKSFHFRDL